MAKEFPITSVTVYDVNEALGEDVQMTDTEMRRIARKMENDYCNQMFWSSLEIIAQGVIDARVKA